MKVYTITPKGQVTIPTEVREKLKLQPGDKITYVDNHPYLAFRVLSFQRVLDQHQLLNNNI